MVFPLPLSPLLARQLGHTEPTPAAQKPGPVDISIAVDVFRKWIGINLAGAVLYWDESVRRSPAIVQQAMWRLLCARLSDSDKEALCKSTQGVLVLLKARLYASRRPEIPTMRFAGAHQEYDFYAGIALQYGSEPARQALNAGKAVLVALRKSSSTIANKGKGSYDDKIAVLKGSAHSRKASSFTACTEPGAQYAQRAAPAKGGGTTDSRYAGVKFSKTEGADANKDGIKDIGRLMEGTYQYFEKANGFLGDRAFEVHVTQVAERDTDGDGRFTADDPSRIDVKGVGKSMLIHRGGADDVVEPNTWSAGCQTIPKNHFSRFLSAVGPSKASFFYVLVNTDRN